MVSFIFPLVQRRSQIVVNTHTHTHTHTHTQTKYRNPPAHARRGLITHTPRYKKKQAGNGVVACLLVASNTGQTCLRPSDYLPSRNSRPLNFVCQHAVHCAISYSAQSTMMCLTDTLGQQSKQSFFHVLPT